MKAVLPYRGRIGSGEAQEVEWGEVDEPSVGPGEALVEIRSAALNRGDLLQMQGLYPPPSGASEVPGLEAAGTILELPVSEDANTKGFAVGDEVVALLAGGGQAERVAVPVDQLLRKPTGLSWAEAGGLAEVALTAWTNLVYEGGLAAGQSVLITAAASGVGSYCVQLGQLLDAEVIVAGRKLHRLEPLLERGARAAVGLGDDLPEQVRQHVPDGVDLVIDLVGGPDLATALAALSDQGRLVLVGLLGGTRCELPLAEILRRRLSLRGSVLRPRSVEEKAGLIASFELFANDHWASGALTPLVDRTLPFERAGDAYRALATEEIFGKIVLVR